MKTVNFILLLLLIGVIVFFGLKINTSIENNIQGLDASELTGSVAPPDIMYDYAPPVRSISTIKIGYWYKDNPGVRRSLDVDTNGIPGFGKFRLRQEENGVVLSDYDFRQNLRNWEGLQGGIRNYIPVLDPPQHYFSQQVIDTIVDPVTGEVGYHYGWQTVVNPEWQVYMDNYYSQMDALQTLYEDEFFVEELMWFPSFTIGSDYVYAIYDPDLPYHLRWVITDVSVVEKWITGAKWKLADQTRIDEKDVYYWFAYWSKEYRATAPNWLAFKFINR